MNRSLLVPLDGSSFGEHALPLAAAMARRSGATLHLMHVHQPVPPATVAGVTLMDTLDLHVRQDEQAYLANTVRRLQEQGPLPIETALVDGDVVPAIHAYADRIAAEVVLMSTHGRGALGRFWLGSVADDLVRELPRPVMLVRPSNGNADLHRDREIKKILLPFDGTPHAEKIIEPAIRLGTIFGASFVLVRVIQPVLRTMYIPECGIAEGTLAELTALQTKQREEAQVSLNLIASGLRERGFGAITHVVVNEEPAVGILKEAEAQHADLIAIETHARRGLSRLLMGSIADKVIRAGVLPVLLHRPVG